MDVVLELSRGQGLLILIQDRDPVQILVADLLRSFAKMQLRLNRRVPFDRKFLVFLCGSFLITVKN